MSGEQYQQGEDFQSAEEHQEGTHQFGKSGHNGEIHGRSEEIESGTDIADAGGC